MTKSSIRDTQCAPDFCVPCAECHGPVGFLRLLPGREQRYAKVFTESRKTGAETVDSVVRSSARARVVALGMGSDTRTHATSFHAVGTPASPALGPEVTHRVCHTLRAEAVKVTGRPVVYVS